MTLEQKGGDLLKKVRDLTKNNEYLKKENKNLEGMVKSLDKNLEQIIFSNLGDKKKLEEIIKEQDEELKRVKQQLTRASFVSHEAYF